MKLANFLISYLQVVLLSKIGADEYFLCIGYVDDVGYKFDFGIDVTTKT